MKKKILLAILTMAMVLTCTACQNSETGKANGSETEVNTQVDSETEVDTDTEVESETETEVQREISPEEEWFATSFFSNEERVMANMFLTCEYDSVADVDLFEVFYCGAIGSETQITEVERTLLQKRYEAQTELDVCKVSTEDMNKVLKKYINLSVDDTAKKHLDMLYYLEEYDAYYLCMGDTHYVTPKFTAFTKNDDGTVVIRYKDALSSSKTEYEVTLKAENDTYYFVSNKVVK